MVYSTDGERKLQTETEIQRRVNFYSDADLVVFGAMYALSEMVGAKRDWRHSSNVIGVDPCLRARVKHNCMFHHQPACGDETIHCVVGESRRCAEIAGDDYALQVSTAHDGLVIDV